MLCLFRCNNTKVKGRRDSFWIQWGIYQHVGPRSSRAEVTPLASAFSAGEWAIVTSAGPAACSSSSFWSAFVPCHSSAMTAGVLSPAAISQQHSAWQWTLLLAPETPHSLLVLLPFCQLFWGSSADSSILAGPRNPVNIYLYSIFSLWLATQFMSRTLLDFSL